MADLHDDPSIPGIPTINWEWDSFLDFPVGSPANIFPWHPEEPAANFGEPASLQGIEIQPQLLETQNSVPGEAEAEVEEHEDELSRIRKRDPRLTCENFLAGRVPCSCPEIEDNEDNDGSRKRAKVGVAVVRCQVPSCEADISHLKGYHRRHRVCLRCANAATVVLDGVSQRYCQQCGKFHLLPDFDEGKRSCRRKLERHNNRRRRKPVSDKASVQRRTSQKESLLQNAEAETYNGGKSGQESKSLSSFGTGEKQVSSGSDELQISEVEQPCKDHSCSNNVELKSADVNNISKSSRPVTIPTGLEGKHCLDRGMGLGENVNDQETKVVEHSPASPSRTLVGPQDGDDSTYAEFNDQSYTGLLIEENSHKDRLLHSSSRWNHGDEGSGPLRSSLSSSGHDKHFSYTSVCPTGRVSFKLYDWNPAEFPRRLRQQILQWLANMPVELEGYIRPGCTILTAFIALPQHMWDKLSADSTSYVYNLLNGNESILSGKGSMLVYLNNIVMQIENGDASLVNAKTNQRVPRLCSVHPVFVEAGRPIEIVACGKNLFQSKFRFLISFGGSYLQYASCETIPLHANSTFRSTENIFHASSHESCKILIPSTDSRLFGPAFIEVENECGISNFIPILIGDKQICSEFQVLEQELMDCRFCCRNGYEHADIACSNFDICKQTLVKRQGILELVLDVGWVLKCPEPNENDLPVNHAHIQRLNCLFSFLINGQFISVMAKVLYSPKVIRILKQVYGKSNEFNDADVELLHNYVKHAWLSVRKKRDYKGNTDSQQFLDKVVMQGQPSLLNSASELGNQHPYECSGESEEIEESQTGIRPSCGLESGDARVFSVDENSMLMPLLEKECCSDISTELKHNKNLGVQKTIDVVGCAQMINIEVKRDVRMNRRVFILTIGVLAVCAGICVALQHPHQVMEISMSLRRCLFGLHKSQEVGSEP